MRLTSIQAVQVSRQLLWPYDHAVFFTLIQQRTPVAPPTTWIASRKSVGRYAFQDDFCCVVLCEVSVIKRPLWDQDDDSCPTIRPHVSLSKTAAEQVLAPEDAYSDKG